MDFLAQFREQFRVFLLPFSGRRGIAGLPILQRARADGIILTQRPKTVAFLEGLLDTGLPVFKLADDSCDRILDVFVAHVLHRASIAQFCAPG